MSSPKEHKHQVEKQIVKNSFSNSLRESSESPALKTQREKNPEVKPDPLFTKVKEWFDYGNKTDLGKVPRDYEFFGRYTVLSVGPENDLRYILITQRQQKVPTNENKVGYRVIDHGYTVRVFYGENFRNAPFIPVENTLRNEVAKNKNAFVIFDKNGVFKRQGDTALNPPNEGDLNNEGQGYKYVQSCLNNWQSLKVVDISRFNKLKEKI